VIKLREPCAVAPLEPPAPPQSPPGACGEGECKAIYVTNNSIGAGIDNVLIVR
jgi:hypothetical protein